MSATTYNKQPEERQVAILLNFIGPEAVEIHDTFTYENEEDSKKIDKVLEAFDRYCNPRKNILHARFLFYTRKQKENESYDSFLTDCKTLIKDCEFKNPDEILRDKIVLDASDRETMDSVIKLGEISLADATEKFRIAEVIRKQTKEIHGEISQEVNTVKTKERTQKKSEEKKKKEENQSKDQSKDESKDHRYDSNVIQCKFCGYKHPKYKCSARGKQCKKCNKFNHFARKCITRNYNNCNNCDNVADNDKDNNCEYYCDCISKVNSISWTKNLKIENKNIIFKLDSGSDVNLIPFNVFDSVRKNSVKSLVLAKNKVKLHAYGGYEIKNFGCVNLLVENDNQFSAEKFIVTKADTVPILGLPTCLKLNLIKKTVNSIKQDTTKEIIMNRYSDIFTGIGCFPFSYKIELIENAVPVSLPPYRLPLKLRDKVKLELDRLCQLDIIEKFDRPTSWASRLTVVEKPDGTLRLCLDPQHLNKNIKDEHYAIPTLADLKSKLANANFFTVLDLKDGFWNVKLHPDSIQYCVFSTIFGCYAFKRLPFGLKISAQIFQKFNTEIFGNIDNVFVYIDDLLIYADTQEKHDQILEQVNVKFNKNKFQFRQREVRYLEHIIFKNNTVEIDPERVRL